MKPRSSGEMEIWSMGRSLPLKCAMGAVMALAEEEACYWDFLERDHRKFRHRGVVARELHYPRFLPRGQRRHEGLARLEHGGEPGETLARQREPDVALEAERHRVLRALEHRGRGHGLALLVEPARLVGLVAEVEE